MTNCNIIDSAFVTTIFFLLLGPIKIIPAFARLTRDTDPGFKRDLTLMGTLFATVICGVVILLAENFVAKYQLSLPAVQITGGLILLISALYSIFPRNEVEATASEPRTALQVALSPLASPVIVTPAGIAAIMVFVLLSTQISGGFQTIVTALAVVMVLNLLVMLFNSAILKIPGLMLVLQLMGTVLIVVQVALAVQVLIYGLRGVGLISGAPGVTN